MRTVKFKEGAKHRKDHSQYIGQKFGRMTVLEILPELGPNGYVLARCRCDCGNEKVMVLANLRNGKTVSCGCVNKEMAAKRLSRDLTGKRFGRLLVINPLERRYADGSLIWHCKCDCGKDVFVRSCELTGGSTRSCGCYRKEQQKKAVTKYYTPNGAHLSSLLNGIRQRCNNPNDHSYARYGGKGIRVCDEWMGDNAVFVKWAEEHGYKPGLQIDRIDNNGPYSPDNCRFVTPMENANNRSDHHWITVGGEKKTIAEWSRLTGVSAKHMYRTPEEKVINEISVAIGLKPHISDVSWMNSERNRLAEFCKEYRLL